MDTKRGFVAVAVVAVVLTAGIGTVGATTESTMVFEIDVTADGTVETIDLAWTIDEETYNDWSEETSEQGYDHVAEAFAGQLARSDPAFDTGTGEDRAIDGGYVLEMTFSDINMDEADATDVRVEDGIVTYHLTDVDDPADDPDVDAVTYRISMPGEIVDSNAPETDGTVAVWEFSEAPPDELFVQSEIDESELDSSEDATDASIADDPDDEGADGLPGFGVSIAIAALLAATGIVVRRH